MLLLPAFTQVHAHEFFCNAGAVESMHQYRSIGQCTALTLKASLMSSSSDSTITPKVVLAAEHRQTGTNETRQGEYLQKACGSSAQPYMGVRKAPLLGPYRPTELKYCLSALTPCSTVSIPGNALPVPAKPAFPLTLVSLEDADAVAEDEPDTKGAADCEAAAESDAAANADALVCWGGDADCESACKAEDEDEACTAGKSDAELDTAAESDGVVRGCGWSSAGDGTLDGDCLCSVCAEAGCNGTNRSWSKSAMDTAYRMNWRIKCDRP